MIGRPLAEQTKHVASNFQNPTGVLSSLFVFFQLATRVSIKKKQTRFIQLIRKDKDLKSSVASRNSSVNDNHKQTVGDRAVLGWKVFH